MRPIHWPCGYAFLALTCLALSATADETARLPGTEPLSWEGDLSAQMLDGAHRLIDRKIEESVELRTRHWHRDVSPAGAYEKSIEPNRQRFARQIGLIDERLPPAMERFGDDDNPAIVASTPSCRIYQVRWPVLEGVWGEGLLLEPVDRPKACVVVLGDADQTPEQLVGLAQGAEPTLRWASALVNSGCLVVVPTLVDRTSRFTGNAISGRPNPGYSHREWIHRQAYHMGRHIIGYEVQKVLAAVDWFASRFGKPSTKDVAQVPLGVAGYGEGGLLAFYAAAGDRRIDSTLVSGYFRSRQRVAEEPLYRNVWALLHEFGDAEIASLIAPRSLTIEYRKGPELVDRQTTTPAEVNGVPLARIIHEVAA